MNSNVKDIQDVSVCLCTYKRPHLLARCLESLVNQVFDLSYEIIVTDNDDVFSARKIVEKKRKLCEDAGIRLTYLTEPIQNIALARNKCLSAAKGKLIAFLDDDEVASSHWLSSLHYILNTHNADGVWGPVVPVVSDQFPEWMRKSGLFDRPRMKSGTTMPANCLRTGNAMVKRELLCLRPGPFDAGLGRSGGSDSELFSWLQNRNHVFIWSDEAEVFEEVEIKRKKILWHLRRAYRGGWGYSRGLLKRYGAIKGFLLSVIRVIPSSLKAFCWAVKNSKNIRYAGLILLTNIATNLGKCGYFLGIKIEEYK